MVTQQLQAQLTHIQQDVQWFITVLNQRFENHFSEKESPFSVDTIPPPPLEVEESHFAGFVQHYNMSAAERLVLILALIPHIQPAVLDVFFTRNRQFDRGYTEFGGVKGDYFSGFLPTGETALFILAGSSLHLRMHYSQIFDSDHFFAKHNILHLENPNQNEPYFSGALTLSKEHIDYFTVGKPRKPRFSTEFPAKPITTDLEWDNLVLNGQTMEQVQEILAWIEYGDILLNEWGLANRIKPGYKSLFFGPPGTGKTLTASLLAKQTGLEVYRIDLSMVVSKFIGETEKNLSKVFDKALNKNWILFFDEADSLFGKRTNVSDAHDRYANQEVSFLLQRIEEHSGLVILASNLKSNIDEAFTRRFQSIIHFPMPRATERLKLWEDAFSSKSKLDPKSNLRQIAEQFELSGGSIINVVRYASLLALRNETNVIDHRWLMTGIKKEFQKEGKTVG